MNVMASIAMPPGRVRFTAADFLRMGAAGAFDDMWVELIEGEIQRMSPPGRSHGRVQMGIIAGLLRTVPQARLLGDVGIDLGNDTIVACDAAILEVPIDGEGMIPSDDVLLVVEVAVSTRDRDLNLKRRLYAAAGIPTYWVVDVERAVIHVFDRPEGDDYMGLALARFGEPLTVPGADGTIVIE